MPAEQSGPHTDQCIRDAARFGFCEHTRLGAPRPSTLRGPTPAARLTPGVRDVYAWVGLACHVTAVYWLATHVGFWPTALIVFLTGLGWLLVFTCGLPRGFDSDLSRVLPPDRARSFRQQR